MYLSDKYDKISVSYRYSGLSVMYSISDFLTFLPRQFPKKSRVKYHWLREQVGAKVVKLVHVPTADMVADIFTKGLSEKLNTKHLNAMTVLL